MLEITAKSDATVSVIEGSFPVGERNQIKINIEDDVLKQYIKTIGTNTCIPEYNLYSYGNFSSLGDIEKIQLNLNPGSAVSIISGYGKDHSRCLYCNSTTDAGLGLCELVPDTQKLTIGEKYKFVAYVKAESGSVVQLNLKDIQNNTVVADSDWKLIVNEFTATTEDFSATVNIQGVGTCYIDSISLFLAENEIINNYYDNIEICVDIVNPCNNDVLINDVITYSKPDSSETYVILYVPPITVLDFEDNILCQLRINLLQEQRDKYLGDSKYNKIKECVYNSNNFILNGYIIPYDKEYQKIQDEINQINIYIKDLSSKVDKNTEDISNLEDKVDTDYQELNDKINENYKVLNTKIDNSVNTLNQSITDANTKIDNVNSTLNDKIDNTKTELDSKIDTTNTELTQKIEDLEDYSNNTFANAFKTTIKPKVYYSSIFDYDSCTIDNTSISPVHHNIEVTTYKSQEYSGVGVTVTNKSSDITYISPDDLEYLPYAWSLSEVSQLNLISYEGFKVSYDTSINSAKFTVTPGHYLNNHLQIGFSWQDIIQRFAGHRDFQSIVKQKYISIRYRTNIDNTIVDVSCRSALGESWLHTMPTEIGDENWHSINIDMSTMTGGEGVPSIDDTTVKVVLKPFGGGDVDVATESYFEIIYIVCSDDQNFAFNTYQYQYDNGYNTLNSLNQGLFYYIGSSYGKTCRIKYDGVSDDDTVVNTVWPIVKINNNTIATKLGIENSTISLLYNYKGLQSKNTEPAYEFYNLVEDVQYNNRYKNLTINLKNRPSKNLDFEFQFLGTLNTIDYYWSTPDSPLIKIPSNKYIQDNSKITFISTGMLYYVAGGSNYSVTYNADSNLIEKEVQQISKDLSTLSTDYNSFKSKTNTDINTLKQQDIQLNDEITLINDSLKDYAKTADVYSKTDADNKFNTIDSFNDYKTSNDKTVKDISTKLNTLEQNFNDYKTSNDQAVQELQTSFNSYKSNTDKAIQDINDELNSQKTEFNSYKTSNDETVLNLTNSFNEYKTSNNEVVNNLSNNLSTLNTSFNEYKTSNDNALNTTNSNLTSLQTNFNNYKTSNDEEISNIKTSISSLNTKVDNQNTELKAYTDQKINEAITESITQVLNTEV